MVIAGGYRWLTLVLLLTAVSPALAMVEVSVDRNPVQLNESFQLVFTLDEMPDRDPASRRG